ncbi:hypothetical protein HFN78_14275 [Rhizobium laguerreae]|uniref:hypothetical protein n=1 Tax=Rhizobium laguerreae TaxID=1076926 RepID=UPI001C8FEA72|nr:hypothetical protein [Rhizobium laguerreae]MBY3472085.1 hypothetical protein [Rhizobium laguerreae]
MPPLTAAVAVPINAWPSFIFTAAGSVMLPHAARTINTNGARMTLLFMISPNHEAHYVIN